MHLATNRGKTGLRIVIKWAAKAKKKKKQAIFPLLVQDLKQLAVQHTAKNMTWLSRVDAFFAGRILCHWNSLDITMYKGKTVLYHRLESVGGVGKRRNYTACTSILVRFLYCNTVHTILSISSLDRWTYSCCWLKGTKSLAIGFADKSEIFNVLWT